MILGIDTSCYTTSMAVVNNDGGVLADRRMVLPVKKGARGLAQSQALFLHTCQLPQVFSLIAQDIPTKEITAVCVSTQPRRVVDSYMPVFRSGESVAKVIAQTLQVPCFFTSHQEGHIMAGVRSTAEKLPQQFLAIHLSGGTSELLAVKTLADGFDIQIITTADLAAGQFVDRIGVALGLPFPAGPHLEVLAEQVEQQEVVLPVSHKFSFSGCEAAAKRLIDRQVSSEQLAYAVFSCVAQTLAATIMRENKKMNYKDVLLVGGVAANSIIRNNLQKMLLDINVHYAQREYSSDNAVGVALIGQTLLYNE